MADIEHEKNTDPCPIELIITNDIYKILVLIAFVNSRNAQTSMRARAVSSGHLLAYKCTYRKDVDDNLGKNNTSRPNR